MEDAALRLLELLWTRSDPLLVFCIILLGYWIHKSNKASKSALLATNRRLEAHLDPKNRNPHPACEWAERNFNLLRESLTQQRTENREDHQEIFRLLREK